MAAGAKVRTEAKTRRQRTPGTKQKAGRPESQLDEQPLHLGWFTSAPQSLLISEAEDLREQRDWKQVRRVLEAANATAVDVDDRRRVLELTATAAAEASKHRISSGAVYELAQIEPRPASTWIAIGDVALARGNYQHADTAAREALRLDPTNNQARLVMAASFAGLGWFDEAAGCLDQIDRTEISERHRYQIGQAVNRWATSKTMAFPFSLLAAVVAGILAISVGLSVPLITRWYRLRQLARAEEPNNLFFVESAAACWATRTKTKIMTAIGIVSPAVAYVGILLTR